VLEGAAVAGDPFELELAATAAATDETATLDAVDALLELDLLRPTDVPRRFRFRHPLVRCAVYESAPAGWRLAAHERCAKALVAAGARAHHVERSARVGDLDAVAVLREAGEATARLAPASAARWLAGALRLLPPTAPARERVDLLFARAGALTATGHIAESHEALVEALAIAPPEMRTKLTTACARTEHLLGRYEQARARLTGALDALPEPRSTEAVDLMIELSLNAGLRTKYQSLRDWAARAVDAARSAGDASLTAAAVAKLALAEVVTGTGDHAVYLEAAALVDALSDRQLALRVDAAAWLAGAELHLGRYAEADAHGGRALAVGRESGQGEIFFVVYQILGVVWYVRGKLAEAAELLDGAIEAARLRHNSEALAWSLFNRSVVALAAGDLEAAELTAEESVDLTRDDQSYVAAWATVRLAATRVETGQAAQAVELLVGSAGGEELELIPAAWRAGCLELLTRCWLALDRPEAAERAADRAQAVAAAVQLPLAGAWAGRAAAAVALHAGDTARAAALALASAGAADEVGAPIEAALSRTLAGRALAEGGEADRAIAELERAAAELDARGALRYRDQAERELGRLGHRTHRRTRPGMAAGTGLDTLTERELQVARLVVDRKTNPEIAAELFLSQKTVQTHLRHIFHKMDVPSRVALARAVERADRAADSRNQGVRSGGPADVTGRARRDTRPPARI
jgi:DNA-binding NarL/FixJ family response regulator